MRLAGKLHEVTWFVEAAVRSAASDGPEQEKAGDQQQSRDGPPPHGATLHRPSGDGHRTALGLSVATSSSSRVGEYRERGRGRGRARARFARPTHTTGQTSSLVGRANR